MGKLAGIFLAGLKTQMPISVEAAQAVAGKGLEGDRYGVQEGTFSQAGDAANEVTLIEAEALEALRRDYDVELSPEASRRNLLTQGVALNHLVGREFSIGEARLEGLRLCEPCGHLEKLTGEGVKQGLRHRGGLRARVSRGGTIRVGDTIN